MPDTKNDDANTDYAVLRRELSRLSGIPVMAVSALDHLAKIETRLAHGDHADVLLADNTKLRVALQRLLRVNGLREHWLRNTLAENWPGGPPPREALSQAVAATCAEYAQLWAEITAGIPGDLEPEPHDLHPVAKQADAAHLALQEPCEAPGTPRRDVWEPKK